jgi:hypothetical protein|tara:strand:+ start:178 stop:387 length:210 start_codon:yes stop_codon:yes gene_type:complete
MVENDFKKQYYILSKGEFDDDININKVEHNKADITTLEQNLTSKCNIILSSKQYATLSENIIKANTLLT